MMLTAETARRVGIADRNDPRESILGGARYLRVIGKTIPERIPDPDRTWMTLAAYNVGYGHLEDARILTQRRGLNADSWIDVRKTLPLLARSESGPRPREDCSALSAQGPI
jgi:membrane-bound lytic murein transglycosylase F